MTGGTLAFLDWPLDGLATLWCAIALFIGYAVRGAAGFGSGVVTVPLMAFVLPLSTLAPLITFLGAFVSVRQSIRDRKLIAWKRLAQFIPGILIGVPLGIWAFKAVDPALLTRALGLYILTYAIYSLAGARGLRGGKAMPSWAAVPIGTLGAIIATLFGSMAGPVYVTYLDALHLPMRVFRVTVATILLALSIVRSTAYLASGVFGLSDFKLVAAAVLPVLLGTLAGERIHDRISPATFKTAVAGLLIASGLALLLK